MAEKQIILVTGSNGQLGSELKELAHFHPHFEFVFLTRNELPLSEPAAIKKQIQNNKENDYQNTNMCMILLSDIYLSFVKDDRYTLLHKS